MTKAEQARLVAWRIDFPNAGVSLRFRRGPEDECRGDSQVDDSDSGKDIQASN